jgi:hypothetical protein
MIALTFMCLFEAVVVGFTVTFVGCFVLDGQQAANLGIVAEMSWVGSVIVHLLRQRGRRRAIPSSGPGSGAGFPAGASSKPAPHAVLSNTGAGFPAC